MDGRGQDAPPEPRQAPRTRLPGRTSRRLARLRGERLGASLRGGGQGLAWYRLPRGETASRGSALRDKDPATRGERSGSRQCPDTRPGRPAYSPRPPLPAPAALTAVNGRRRSAWRARSRDSAQVSPPPPPHVTRAARLPSPGVSTRPALLGKMAAPSWGVLRLRLRGSGRGGGGLLCLVPKPFCTAAAAASKPLDAQRLAEKLRAQKREQKAKKEPVSLEGKTTIPKRQCALVPQAGEGPLRECKERTWSVGENGVESGGRGPQRAVPACALVFGSRGLGAKHPRSQFTGGRRESYCKGSGMPSLPRCPPRLLEGLPHQAFPVAFSLPVGAQKPCPAEGARTSAVHAAAATSPPQRAR